MIASRRRGFALIAAIGVLVVLGLIVAALGDSVQAQRQVSRAWEQSAEERLAIRWAVETLRTQATAGKASTEFEGQWGNLVIRGQARPLPLNSPIYGHPALAHRPGDQLLTVTVGDSTEHLLLRTGPPITWHNLPPDLLPSTIATPSEETAP